MKDSIKYGDEGGKDFGCAADELTPQACYRSYFPLYLPVDVMDHQRQVGEQIVA
ncbi:hypothetical protein [Yersinia hibernica]|uniref:hypothetical protein n=1 Tax=Yersinia hibernica TaxID=2339259 RepID=UPI00042F02B9|nr:hypothetical protein [Yersinia hibernica]